MSESRIKDAYLMYLRVGILAEKTMKVFKDTLGEGSQQDKGLSRRSVLRGLMAGAAGLTLASLPLGQDAEAGEAKAATPGERGLDAVQGRRDMRHYSEDPNSRGIGVFINLQHDATLEQGRDLGDWLKAAFASRGVPVEYRLNQSRGTATDLTFYVKGVDFAVNVGSLKEELPQMLAHHRGAWLPDTVSLNTQPQ